MSEIYRAGLPSGDLVRTEEDPGTATPAIPEGNCVHLITGVNNTIGLFRACQDRTSATAILTVDDSGAPVVAFFAQPRIPHVYTRVGSHLSLNGAPIAFETRTPSGKYALRRPRKDSARSASEQKAF